MTGFPINPPQVPLTDARGLVTKPWYRFFMDIQVLIGGPSNPFDEVQLLAEGNDALAFAAIANRRDELAPPPVPVAPFVDMLTPYPQMYAVSPIESIIVACSDETTAITTGTAKVTFRMPYAFTLTAVRASVTTAPTGSTILIDINEGGTTILSTKLMIDASEKTSTTAATPAVISDISLADDAEITIDFDQVGSTIAGAGVKVALIGQRT